jgi:hypothetical protein
MDGTPPVWSKCPGPSSIGNMRYLEKKKKGRKSRGDLDPFRDAIPLQHNGAREQKPRTLHNLRGFNIGN